MSAAAAQLCFPASRGLSWGSAFKHAATMQASQGEPAPILIRIEIDEKN